MNSLSRIGFGGGCHWCTEAVFQSIIGIEKVEQGYIASEHENDFLSEAVVVHFYPEKISLKTLIAIHLYTHKSKSNHSMRSKYRSAVYTFSKEQFEMSQRFIDEFQTEFDNRIITKVLPFKSFKASREEITNYYFKNPNKPFCETFINPKLKFLLNAFSKYTKKEQLNHIYKKL